MVMHQSNMVTGAERHRARLAVYSFKDTIDDLEEASSKRTMGLPYSLSVDHIEDRASPVNYWFRKARNTEEEDGVLHGPWLIPVHVIHVSRRWIWKPGSHYEWSKGLGIYRVDECNKSSVMSSLILHFP